MINSILIANRGEIACRIIRTAKKLGIKSYVIYSTEDESSLAVKLADKAFLLKSTYSEKKDYLDGEQIIKIAQKNKIEAIHPGYGFLSENSNFAKLVEDTGIKFIGPPYKAIEIMGDKIISKKHAKNIDVSTIPGLQDEIKSYEDAIKAADKIGFPLMIKASAGGGGKGMRIVYEKKELKDKFKSAKNEAETSFGDSRVFIEKFIEEPRHIEIQIVGDQFGNYLHLGERDCSIQRRNQKIIEEAPATGLNEKELEQVLSSCINLCEKLSYEGAGTIEFLYKDGKFFFIEMNARIQVEHPVTEMISMFDIVKAQLKIALDMDIKLDQNKVTFRGHAIECRINAEDPLEFKPCPGKIIKMHPPGGFGIRFDSHIYSGYVVPPYYDSLLAKIITTTNKRESCIRRMNNALDEFFVEGIETNHSLHSKILNDQTFRDNNHHINYLESDLIKRIKNESGI